MKFSRLNADTASQISLTFLVCLYVNWHLVTPTASFHNDSQTNNIFDNDNQSTQTPFTAFTKVEDVLSTRSDEEFNFNNSTNISIIRELEQQMTPGKFVSTSVYKRLSALTKQKDPGDLVSTSVYQSKPALTKQKNPGDLVSTSVYQRKPAITKQKAPGKVVLTSVYQSKPVPTKGKPELAGSQDAPEDATHGHMTMHPYGKPNKLIFCYFGSSSNSRPGLGKFWPEHIDPFLCTHLVFAFVDITEDGTGLRPNNWNDLGENGLYTRTTKLKEKNPDLKILLAVGGWKIGSKPFLPVIKSEEIWKTWVSNVVIYLRKYNFDGFDMDWEFPTWRGSGPEDKHKLTLLMKDLYEAFAEEAISSGKDKLLLTLAAAASAFYAEKAYEKSEIYKYFDYMLLMTYNYHGSGWEKHTGHHSPLLPHPLDPEGEQRELYILWSVKYWLNFGVPREKIILGLSTYGLGWKLTDMSQTGVRAPADGGTTKGKYTEEGGILSHYEICDYVINDGWQVEWIEEQKVPYAYGGGEWVGFDSPDSFYLKAATIIAEGLAGAFVWSVEMDDFHGHCGGPKYPLLRTIYEVFTQSSSLSNLDAADTSKYFHPANHKKVSDHTRSHSSSAAAVESPHPHDEESATSDQSAISSHDHQAEADSDKDTESSNFYMYDDNEESDLGE